MHLAGSKSLPGNAATTVCVTALREELLHGGGDRGRIESGAVTNRAAIPGSLLHISLPMQ